MSDNSSASSARDRYLSRAGMRVEEVACFYKKSGPAMFDKVGLIRRFKEGKFDDKKLAVRLQELIKERRGTRCHRSAANIVDGGAAEPIPRGAFRIILPQSTTRLIGTTAT